MATSFKIRYSASVIPTEEVQLSDTSNVSYNINSNIDKALGGSFQITAGTSSNSVRYKEYLTTTSAVALNHSTIFNAAITFGFLFIKIASAGSTGTPDCSISLDSGTHIWIKLQGVGDCIMIPLGGTDQLGSSVVQVSSSGATTVANLEIIGTSV